eukprot:6022447-Amphidinium_carterae.1
MAILVSLSKQLTVRVQQCRGAGPRSQHWGVLEKEAAPSVSGLDGQLLFSLRKQWGCPFSSMAESDSHLLVCGACGHANEDRKARMRESQQAYTGSASRGVPHRYFSE